MARSFGWEPYQHNMLVLLVENMGLDAVVSLGDLAAWEEAVKRRRDQNGTR